MRLNARIRLIIIPIIIIGAVFISSIIYQLEKKSLIRQEKINLQLQSTKMSFMANAYITFSDAYFATLIRSTSLKSVMNQNDESLLAHSVENNLSTLLSELSTLEVGTFSLAVLNYTGKKTYYFEDSDDPFSETNGKLINYSNMLYFNELTEYKNVLRIDGSIKIIQGKILNPLTMKEPISERLYHAKSIVMMFGMLELDQLITSLTSNGYTIRLSTSEAKSDEAPDQYGLLVAEEIYPNLWLQINYNNEKIKSALTEILIRLIIYTLLLVVIISSCLLFLISKNITNPILNLRNKIWEVNNGKTFSKPNKANDEISLLNVAYYDLYIKLKSSYEKSQELSNIDSLTKLNNRNVFNKQLEGLMSRELKHGKLSLLYIDIDNFKYINDNFGHEAGDLFLVEFAASLRSILRPTDLVVDRVCEASRLAGDEFGVIIYDYEDDAIIKHIALRVMSVFKNGFESSIGNLPVSASIGISAYPSDGLTPNQLIINADSAMYQAKRNGKNQYGFFSKALADKAKREFNIELELQNLDISELELFYMPIIDTTNKNVIGVEALIRWSSNNLGNITPDEFIPIAEMKGHFKKIDLWVFNNVLDNYSELKNIIGSNSKISVNISSAQLATHDFIPSIVEPLDSAGISADNFILEITETFSTIITPLVISNLNLLKAKGFLLALDDFGSGYTSIVQLIDYPIDIIKIDKSMIDRIEAQGNVIVASLTSVCQSNGYSVTAEGVESIEQVAILESIGVNSMQGYYFCKPLPLVELSKKYLRQ